ncbi:MAG: EamA family transporter RarD [Phycisphaerales bacterium]|nr:EamA family transporter RarD [Phycisphaerales bacterium]
MAVGAYGWWAVVAPLYYHVVEEVSVGELLAWRVVAGLPLLTLMLLAVGRLHEVVAVLKRPRVLVTLGLSGILIAVNWTVFVVSVIEHRLSDASLGYYICPLFSVALGMVVLGERMRLAQWVAIGLAAAGVGVLAWRTGGLPWIALALAGSFGLYGLIRKQVDAAPAPGLAVEMLFLLPFMVVLLFVDHSISGSTFMKGSLWTAIVLFGGGIVTVVPLILFAGGARRLQLSTVAILQYISPTGQLLLAVLAFDEPFGIDQSIAFALIWMAVTVYSIDTVRSARRPAVTIPGEA